jgi:pilus assembly protein CpaE
MKISIVSPELRHAHALQQHLTCDDKRHAVTCITGSASSLAEAFSTGPDLIIFAEAGSMDSVLAQVDALVTTHPGAQIVLASEQQSSDFLRAAMRAGAREVLPLSASKAALDEAVASVEKKTLSTKKSQKVGKLFAFIGCKGGAGTTFLATNWAHVFASEPRRKVAFIDLNRQFGDALFYLSDETPAMDVADLVAEAHRLDASLLAGSMVCVRPNLHLLAAAETPEKGQAIGVAEISSVLKHAVREYDVVIVDVGNVVDEISAVVMDVADVVYPVMQATIPYLRAATRLLKVLRAYPREKVEWIVNRYEEQGDVNLRDIQGALNHGTSRTIAGNFRTVSAAIAQGVPLSELDKRGRVVRDLHSWVAAIFPQGRVAIKPTWIQRLGVRVRPMAHSAPQSSAAKA